MDWDEAYSCKLSRSEKIEVRMASMAKTHVPRYVRLTQRYEAQGRSRESIERMLRQVGAPEYRPITPKIFAPNDRRRVPRA